MTESEFEKARVEYYKLLNWTLEDHPVDDHIIFEITRWANSLKDHKWWSLKTDTTCV